MVRTRKRNGLDSVLWAHAITSGRSAADLAQSAGLPGCVVSRFLDGSRSMKVESAAKLANALNLELVARS